MFHNIKPLRPLKVSDQALALAALEVGGGEIVRVFGYDDENREIDLNYGVVRGETVHDADGAHALDKWLVESSQRATNDDFWCHERLRPQDVDALRLRIVEDEMETARLIAMTPVWPSPREGT